MDITNFEREKERLNILLVANRLKPATLTHSDISLREISILELIAEEHSCPFGVRLSSAVMKFNEFYMAIDQKHLDDLFSATTKSGEKKYRSLGRVFGYPEPAIEFFIQNRNCVQQMYQSLAKAELTGIEIPSWLAYISHIPEKLDFVTGNIAPTSKELGEKYQAFMRKRCPRFSKKLEAAFQEHLQVIRALILSVKA